MLETNLRETPKKDWKKFVKEQIIHLAFTNLVEENKAEENKAYCI